MDLTEAEEEEELKRIRVLLKRMVSRSTISEIARAVRVNDRNLANFLNGEVKTPRGTTRGALLEWARSESRHSVPTAAVAAEGTVANSQPEPITAVIRAAQREQLSWIADFASKLLAVFNSEIASVTQEAIIAHDSATDPEPAQPSDVVQKVGKAAKQYRERKHGSKGSSVQKKVEASEG